MESDTGGQVVAEVQDRHRKAAAKAFGAGYMHDVPPGVITERGYAQVLADVEDANGYDLTACRAAYALVCEAVTPGVGPGGAEAVAMSVQLLRRRAERAEAGLKGERERIIGLAREMADELNENGRTLAKYPGQEAEGRLRQLAAGAYEELALILYTEKRREDLEHALNKLGTSLERTE